jgi:hypothetical protein
LLLPVLAESWQSETLNSRPAVLGYFNNVRVCRTVAERERVLARRVGVGHLTWALARIGAAQHLICLDVADVTRKSPGTGAGLSVDSAGSCWSHLRTRKPTIINYSVGSKEQPAGTSAAPALQKAKARLLAAAQRVAQEQAGAQHHQQQRHIVDGTRGRGLGARLLGGRAARRARGAALARARLARAHAAALALAALARAGRAGARPA